MRIRCEECDREVQRIAEVGDVWLDAGIVPFSTLGWENDKYIAEGYATGAAKGLTTADLPDHAYWQEWFPADWVSEMREQIRLWFYSQLFMSVTLTGRLRTARCSATRRCWTSAAGRCTARGATRSARKRRSRRMGADVMRWQYSAQPPNQNLLFGFGPGKEIQRKLLTLWNSVSFLASYANTSDFTPGHRRPGARPRGMIQAPIRGPACSRSTAGCWPGPRG